VVGIVANFNRPVKRVDLFIEAAARVHARHPETRFFIVGGGGLEAKLRRLAHRLGLGHAVVFAGPQANSLSYIKTFTIGVLCSDSEGFPNVLLEYMAASIPAVATAVGGNTELITHGVNGLLCPANDAEALAQRICELVASPARRASLARQALSTVRDEFGLDTQMKRLVALYASTSTGQLRTSPRGGGNPTCS
jgi:glycosyltransferase involved in cell wall biosynthesis